MKQTKAPVSTPSQKQGEHKLKTEVGNGQSPSSVFISLVIDMTWRLALAVLIPIIGGFELDKALHTTPVLLVIGFVLAMIGTAYVLWRSMKVANSLPVPKLSAAEKRAVQKRYEEDDANA